ncbi:hypothetical protein NPN19_25205, partial [Vibrio parahaemolyticus]|uniref:hypothetical protein n=1 Tax=Vibrio parahaemolyticus TaxID=670 RepID=UPI002113430F
MDLNSFLQKYAIILRPAMSDLCDEGMRRMRASADPLHNEAHVFNVTQLADQLLENERSLD